MNVEKIFYKGVSFLPVQTFFFLKSSSCYSNSNSYYVIRYNLRNIKYRYIKLLHHKYFPLGDCENYHIISWFRYAWWNLVLVISDCMYGNFCIGTRMKCFNDRIHIHICINAPGLTFSSSLSFNQYYSLSSKISKMTIRYDHLEASFPHCQWHSFAGMQWIYCVLQLLDSLTKLLLMAMQSCHRSHTNPCWLHLSPSVIKIQPFW